MEEKCKIEKKGGWSSLLKNEDWLAVWLGALIIVLILASYNWKLIDLSKINVNFKWTTDSQIALRTAKWKNSIDPLIKEAEAKGEQGTVIRLQALKEALDQGDRKAIVKAAGKVENIGGIPAELGKEIADRSKAETAKTLKWDNLSSVIKIGIAFLIISSIGIILLGRSIGKYIAGFPVVFFLAWLSRFLAGNALPSDWGIEYVIFALIVGLAISNTVGLPGWVKEAVQTEYYIKTGLVILGAGLLFFEILQAGALGIIQALLVILVVWYCCFWLCRKLKVDDEFAVMLSSAVSICGVSAAIASCGAIEGDKKKLSYVTSLVLICAVPMMVLMPWAVKALGIPDLVGGAWLGGTLDTSGSVVAAGALISEPAMKTGVIVKFSQNALIGVAAFILSIWWTFKKGAAAGQRPTAGVIWERFPKFVLGFIVASFVFSFILPLDTVNDTKKALTELRTWWFALAFVSIGLETRFLDMMKMEGGRPAAAFLLAQSFNIIWTLILAYLLFGGIIFAVPDIR
ncbi:MAG: putative sulfate exporter family transporter [Nitrospirae bacterium]|nr:putative sulfate exporter family transporter [Nitrospirota bacterium]